MRSATVAPGPDATVAERIDELKLHEIDLSDGAVLETNCVYIVPLLESLALPPQIEARRLDLALDKGIGRQDQARIRHRRDHAIRQYAVGVGGKRKRHDVVPGRRPRSHPNP